MKAHLKAIWKRSKWVLFAIGGAVLVALAFVFRGLVTSCEPKRGSNRAQTLPTVDERVKARVAEVEEEATVARIEAKVRASTDREQLERINQVDDGVERRRRLAAMLRRL